MVSSRVEIRLLHLASGTMPIVRKLGEWCSRRYSLRRVPLLGVVKVSAYSADVLARRGTIHDLADRNGFRRILQINYSQLLQVLVSKRGVGGQIDGRILSDKARTLSKVSLEATMSSNTTESLLAYNASSVYVTSPWNMN